jgi:DUF1680 family protein
MSLFYSGNLAAQDPYAKVKEKEETLTRLSINEIKPTGWMLDLMRKDMDGFVGHLDSIVPILILQDDIYGKDRVSKNTKQKNIGKRITDEMKYFWWSSETQSNWRDGYVRTAFLLNDKQHLEKVKDYINHILATQDEDGYLGIYAPDIRYHFNEDNAELFAKASLYRVLLAYYDFTGDKKVLKAVERGVQNVMDNYKINDSQPFNQKEAKDGTTHGLIFTDVLDRLYQLTHDVKYWDYALFLYKDYSIHISERNTDVLYKNIMNPEYRLYGHAVHTHEHLRPLIVAAYASGNPLLQEALQIYLNRLKEVTTCTGGPIGDEGIGYRKADPTFIGYEYCTMHELLDAYTLLIQKTGDIRYADEVEKLFFNAAMGARHPEKSAICYIKPDNAYFMNETLNGLHHRSQCKYSPAHLDVAVCCPPNAGRIVPYYIHNMWLKDKDGFIASLLGGCEVNTQFGKQAVSIKEMTDYPHSNRIVFEVEVKKPITFVLKIRKPAWNKGFSLDTDYNEDGNYIVINKKWSGKESFTIEWKAEIEKHEINNEIYFTYGGLVLALPIEAIETPKKVYYADFQDFEYVPKNLTVYRYTNNEMPVKDGNNFTVNLYNPIRQRMDKKQLVPMEHTILRQVTFENKYNNQK